MTALSRARTIALVSVGSGAVSVGIAHVESAKTEFLVAERRALPLEERTPEHALGALKHLMLDMSRLIAGKGAPQALYCVVRAPWTTTRIAAAETDLEKEERVTESMLLDLTKQALTVAQIPRAAFLDATLIHVRLNGYATEHPIDSRAHHIAITELISMCEEPTKRAIAEGLETLFPALKPKIFSGARALFEFLHAERPDIVDGLVLDISEDGTEILILRSGAIAAEAYAPEGIRTILASAHPHGVAEDARAVLALAGREQSSTFVVNAVQQEFAKNEADLARRFGKIFATLTAERRLPPNLYLMADPSISALLQPFFTRIDFTQFTTTAQPFVVSNLPHTRETPADLDLALALINK